MSNQTDNKDLPAGEVAKWLNTGFDQADPQRVEGLERLLRLQTIRETLFKREHARLAAKLGPNHPRVKALEVRLEASRHLQRDLSIGIDLGRTPVVAADPKVWTLHGHVRDASFRGQEDLTVALYDENDQWIEELKQACTNAHGYFRLTVTGRAPKAEDATDAEVAKEKLSRIAADKTSSGAYIHVTNKAGVTLYVDPDSVTPRLGAVLHRDIVLSGEGGECAPPEREGRAKARRGGKDKTSSKDKSKR